MVIKINKQKKYFWILSIFFIFIVFICLGYLWNGSSTGESPMMGDTMGSMMKQMHSPKTLSDLFQVSQLVKNDNNNDSNSKSSHHQGDTLLNNIHYASTAAIVCLLPIMIGGLVLLLVIWV